MDPYAEAASGDGGAAWTVGDPHPELGVGAFAGLDAEDSDGEYGESAPPRHFVEWEPLNKSALRLLHNRMDGNKDGTCTRTEMLMYQQKVLSKSTQESISEMVKAMDENHDGKISYAEYMGPGEFVNEREKMVFKAADKDGSGDLNATEMQAVIEPGRDMDVLTANARASFNDMNTNNDTVITLLEFVGLEAGMEPGEDKNELLNQVDDSSKKQFTALDKNHDGNLSLEELRAWESGEVMNQAVIDDVFVLADKDRDGGITADELERAADAMNTDESQTGVWSTMRDFLQHEDL